jgi:hypothetical protein
LFQSEKFGYSDFILNDSLFKGIAHKYVYDWFQYDDETGCLANPDNDSQPEQLYGSGLGTMHYMDSTSDSEYYKLDMVYFQVGLLTWGTPYDFSNLDVAVAGYSVGSVHIFPNPADNFLNFTLQEPEQVLASVYTAEGRLVFEKIFTPAIHQLQIDISGLQPGMYLLKIRGNRSNSAAAFMVK